ncbi:hypothetical protein R1flu_009574 [Riccia fluitans]|uniref:Uncharacterized protein n=1 Tax=Riccia fluitans TaxID=41844 RepID=A0ABD1Z6N8_9MARC
MKIALRISPGKSRRLNSSLIRGSAPRTRLRGTKDEAYGKYFPHHALRAKVGKEHKAAIGHPIADRKLQIELSPKPNHSEYLATLQNSAKTRNATVEASGQTQIVLDPRKTPRSR